MTIPWHFLAFLVLALALGVVALDLKVCGLVNITVITGCFNAGTWIFCTLFYVSPLNICPDNMTLLPLTAHEWTKCVQTATYWQVSCLFVTSFTDLCCCRPWCLPVCCWSSRLRKDEAVRLRLKNAYDVTVFPRTKTRPIGRHVTIMGFPSVLMRRQKCSSCVCCRMLYYIVY